MAIENKYLISIILPVYNAKKYIERTLNALINQTYKNIEILCINDGSIDSSLDILNEFEKKDKRIKVFSHKNSGPAKTRNVGLKNATGDYIMFCDADDYYEDNMCELMLKAMIEENTDIVLCDCNIVNTYNSNIRNKQEFEYFKLKLKNYYNLGIYEYMIINSVIWNKIFKKSIIDNNNITFIDGYEHDDTNFVYKYLCYCNSYYGLNNKLYNYEISNPNSIMSTYYTNNIKNNKKLDFIYSHHNLLEFIIENKLRHQIFLSIIKMYEESVISFAKFLDKKQLIEMINIQKEFFKNHNEFNEFPYIQEIKNSNMEKCLNRFKMKFTFLELIFSIKNKSIYEKVVTILGFQFFIKRY